MQEIRGIWIPNLPHSQVLSSRTKIIAALDFLQDTGFNVVFPVVWNQGFTLFPSRVMPSHGFDEIHSFFAGARRDPLAELIDEAHQRKIAVIPWFEYGFACSARADGGHILASKSNWSALKQDNRLLVSGGLAWMNALNPEVQNFMSDLILEVVREYDVDGIQGDDRLPALPSEGGYDRSTKDAFLRKFGVNPPTNTKETKWLQWRADILTDFLATLRDRVKAIKPNLLIAMAPAVFPFCFENLLQDSKTWVKRELVDLIHPQVYRSTFTSYQREIDAIKRHFSGYLNKFAPGIAFKAQGVDLGSDYILRAIALNRSLGMAGQVFFFNEGLLKIPRGESQTIAQVLKTKVYDRVAELPPPL
jgi:uncharacterized lipoprotein YddW (UPF0748 family)